MNGNITADVQIPCNRAENGQMIFGVIVKKGAYAVIAAPQLQRVKALQNRIFRIF